MSKNSIKQKNNWQIIARKGVNFELLIISMVARGLYGDGQLTQQQLGVLKVKRCRQLDGHRDLDAKEAASYSQKLKALYRQKRQQVLKIFLSFEKDLKKFQETADELGRINYKLATDKELRAGVCKFAAGIGQIIRWDYNYYFLQNLPNQLYTILHDKLNDDQQTEKYFELLTQAKFLSAIQREQLSLIELAKRIIFKKSSIGDQWVQKTLNNHLNKYYYFGYFYFRGKPWTLKYVAQRLNKIMKTNNFFQYNRISHMEQENKIWRRKAKALNLNHNEQLLIRIIKQMSYTTNLFDEVCNYAIGKTHDMWLTAAARLSVKYDQLIEMDVAEVLDYLKHGEKVGRVFIREINQRKKDSVLLMENGQVRILTGESLKKYKLKELKKHTVILKNDIISGQAVYKGVVSGRVVKVYDISDLKKVKKGDIMVSRATVPSFAPAIERAAAILAETGGLLSHAAIVSRELGVPCIVGIYNIMELLNDGDLVEVDANRGIVSKLK